MFTEEGQNMFLKVRDNVKRLLNETGAFQMQKAFKNVYGDSWLQLACIDRLVELREIVCIPNQTCMTQNKVYIEY